MSTQEDAEQKVIYCVQKLVEIIVYSRNCFPAPFLSSKEPSSKESNMKHSIQYTKEHIFRNWKHDVYSSLNLTIYLKVNSNDLVLLESWTFRCLRGGNDQISGRSNLSRRIGILIRSLYCYVRLLPAFNLSYMNPDSLVFKFDPQTSSETLIPLSNDFVFPRLISPPIGFLIAKVSYLDIKKIKNSPCVSILSLLRKDTDAIQKDSPPKPSSLPMLIPEANLGRYRSNSMNDPNFALLKKTSPGERSRSSDSNPLFLQEAQYGALIQLNNLKINHETEYNATSISPLGITPPFSTESILSRTPEGYYGSYMPIAGISTNKIRDGIPPLSPAVKLLSTSPQQNTILDVMNIRNLALSTVNKAIDFNKPSSSSSSSIVPLTELPISPFLYNLPDKTNQIALTSYDSLLGKVKSTNNSRRPSLDLESTDVNPHRLSNNDELSNELDTVFALDEDLPFFCADDSDAAFTVPTTIDNPLAPLTYNDKLSDPPMLQSFLKNNETVSAPKADFDFNLKMLQDFKQFHNSFTHR